MSELQGATHNKKISTIIIVFCSLISIIFVTQWVCLSKSIQSVKNINESKYKSLAKIKTNLVDVKEMKKDKGIYFLDKKHIETINNNLESLSQEIFNERNKAETIIDKDIDRLNLYMALGIGFVAILGIFVPLLINFLSYDELKDNQNKLRASYTDLIDKTENLPSSEELRKVIVNSEELLAKSGEIDKLKTATEIIGPQINTIGLQVAIQRLFTVNDVAIKNFVRGKKELYVGLYEQLLSELTKCKADSLHFIANHQSFKQTLIDFSVMLSDEKFRFTSMIDIKHLDIKLSNLSTSLKILSASNTENENANYESCSSIIGEIIALLKS